MPILRIQDYNQDRGRLSEARKGKINIFIKRDLEWKSAKKFEE